MKSVTPFESEKYKDHQCTATSKRSGERCKNYAIKGSRTCRFHGGTVGKGVMSPTFKHGRYSKHIANTKILESYERFLQDDDLLSLRDEIALIAARNAELFQQFNEGNSRQLWRNLRDEYKRFSTETDTDKRQIMLANILRLIQTGGREFEIWDEIASNMETQRKLSDTERRRIIEANLMITADRAMGLIMAMVSIFKQNVNKYATDTELANRILASTGRDIDALIGQNGGVNTES